MVAEHEPAVSPGGQEGQWFLTCIRNTMASRTREVTFTLNLTGEASPVFGLDLSL